MLLGCSYRESSFNNRCISSASAEISREIIGCSACICLIVPFQHCADRHHESWSAITTLRSVTFAHRFLCGRQVIAALHPLYGDDVRPIHLSNCCDAGIHRLEIQILIRVRTRMARSPKHGACTTIAFSANDLRSTQSRFFSQPLCKHHQCFTTANLSAHAIQMD